MTLRRARRWCSAATTTSAWSTPRTRARRRRLTSSPFNSGPRTLIDGGVFAINPAILAYAEANGRIDVLASLGTGEQTRRLPYDDVKDWGQIEWARPIIDVVFDGSADVVDTVLERLIDDTYIRLQTRLDEASDDLDDASPENLAALRREAEQLIAQRSADIDRLCALVT